MLRYVGDGTELPGAPPRNLSDGEAAIWGALIGEVDAGRAAAGLGPLYVVVDGEDEEPDGHGPTRTGTDGHGPTETGSGGATAADGAGGRRRGRRVDG